MFSDVEMVSGSYEAQLNLCLRVIQFGGNAKQCALTNWK